MKFFLLVVGWILVLCGALMFVSVAVLRETAVREADAILTFGFGVVTLGLRAILGALNTREQQANRLRDDATPEARNAPASETNNQPRLVWTGQQWKMLRPFFGPKQPGRVD
jgi:hypothetical protein